MALTKADLAERLFTKFGVSKRDAKLIVEAFFEEIRVALEAGDQVAGVLFEVQAFAELRGDDHFEEPAVAGFLPAGEGCWDGDLVAGHVEADAVGVGAFAGYVAAVGGPLAADVVRRVRYADGAALFVGLTGADGGR